MEAQLTNLRDAPLPTGLCIPTLNKTVPNGLTDEFALLDGSWWDSTSSRFSRLFSHSTNIAETQNMSGTLHFRIHPLDLLTPLGTGKKSGSFNNPDSFFYQNGNPQNPGVPYGTTTATMGLNHMLQHSHFGTDYEDGSDLTYFEGRPYTSDTPITIRPDNPVWADAFSSVFALINGADSAFVNPGFSSLESEINSSTQQTPINKVQKSMTTYWWVKL